jgi:hypothetical protein
MVLPIPAIISLVGQLLTLSLKIADIIDRSDNINAEDKQAMKAAIKKANDGVTYWLEDDT